VGAQLTTREDSAQASGDTPVDVRYSPQGRVSRIMPRNSNGFELPDNQMDIAKIGTVRRDGLGLADTSKGAMQDVL